MLFTSLFERLDFRTERAGTARRQRPPRKRAASIKLCLEALEDRSLPSAATFSGLPYIVGPTVQPTTTSPEAEEVIAVDPNNSKTLVAAIIDASQASVGSSGFSGERFWSTNWATCSVTTTRIPA